MISCIMENGFLDVVNFLKRGMDEITCEIITPMAFRPWFPYFMSSEECNPMNGPFIL